jgi:BirA family biotin operon repressor/biotin-[acetyl-CoA-carboxylase] ligase
MIIGKKIYYLDQIDSTNEYAKTLIDEVPEGTVILADQQTNGKGRSGKTWYSPVGGIWMSAILRPTKPSLIPIMAGVAICETFYLHNILTGIKWPNDILLNNKKIAGILTELVDSTVILGIGINLNIRKFPSELEETASSIFLETKKNFDKKMIYEMLCKQLDEYYFDLKNDQIKDLLMKWRHYTVMLGRNVIIEQVDKKVTGRVLDINNDGALVIACPSGKIERVGSGVCHILTD